MNLPNSLTVTRIFIVPILVVVLLTPYVEGWLGITRYAIAIVLFLAAAITDFFDGHLARKRNQVSRLGMLLDPIADKLLISSALVVLVEKNLAPAWAVVIILGREFAITGLRSIAAADGLIISAQMSGKLKMWAQCIAIVALLVAGAQGPPPISTFGSLLPTVRFWEVPELQTSIIHLFAFSMNSDDWRVFAYTIGRAFLWLAVIASIWSLFEYFAIFRKADKQKKTVPAVENIE